MRIPSRRPLRRASRHALLAALGGFVPVIVGAQQPSLPAAAGATTRLGDVYAAVLRDNPKVAAAQALVRAADARVPAVKRPPDPQLQLGFMNYTLPDLAPMQPLGMTQLQLMQMVPLGGKLGLAGRAARAQASATGERAKDVAWELRSQAAMAFYDLYAADRRLSVARETLRLLQDVARTAESMYRVGEGRQADALRAQVEIARMAEDTVRMQAMRASMLARLGALLDRDAASVVSRPVLPAFPESVPERAWLDSVATGTRPMIRAGLEEVRAADARATLARRELIPDLTVGVQYGRAPTTMRTAGADGMAPRGSIGVTERKTEHMGSLMIGASIPIFARDRQLRMRNEMSAMKAMAEADLRAMRAETRGRIGEAYASLNRARALSRLYRTTVLPQAEATVASALSAYRVGQVDFVTLLDDRMTVNKYREELSQLEADEGKAWAELEMLTGRELLDASRSAVDPTTNGPAQDAPATRGGR